MNINEYHNFDLLYLSYVTYIIVDKRKLDLSTKIFIYSDKTNNNVKNKSLKILNFLDMKYVWFNK